MNKQKWFDYVSDKGFESFEIYQKTLEQKEITYYQK